MIHSEAEKDFPLQFNNKLFTLQGEVGAWSLVTLMILAGQEVGKGQNFAGLRAGHPDLHLTGK